MRGLPRPRLARVPEAVSAGPGARRLRRGSQRVRDDGRPLSGELKSAGWIVLVLVKF